MLAQLNYYIVSAVLLSTPSKFHNGQHRNKVLYISQTLHVAAHFLERKQKEKIEKRERCNKDEFSLTARHLNIDVVTHFLTCRLMTVFTPP